MSKYMITGIGESEIILTGNSKSKLTKKAIEIAKASFQAYIENCEYLQENPDIEFEDFKCFEIEDCNENFIERLLQDNKYFQVYEVK